MTGLIILLILIPLIAFIILVIILNRTSEQQKLTESLYDRIRLLSEDIAALTKEVRTLKQPVETKSTIVKEKPVQKSFVSPPIATPKEEAKPVFISEIKKQELQSVIEKQETPRSFISSSKPVTDL